VHEFVDQIHAFLVRLHARERLEAVRSHDADANIVDALIAPAPISRAGQAAAPCMCTHVFATGVLRWRTDTLMLTSQVAVRYPHLVAY
jgi:hypothetical protein